jgi:alpha-D-xyloside xylohydrolase
MLRSAALIPFLLAASASFASEVRFGAAALLTESRRSLDAPLDRIPLFVRDGAILPKTPEDVMTLAPQSDFKDQGVRALDDRRVYEIYPGHEARGLIDFEGRVLAYDPGTGTLTITGSPARVSVRWRFAHPATVTVNGQKIDKVTATSDGISVDFPHQGTSTVVWR